MSEAAFRVTSSKMQPLKKSIKAPNDTVSRLGGEQERTIESTF